MLARVRAKKEIEIQNIPVVFLTDPEGDGCFMQQWKDSLAFSLGSDYRFVYGGDISGSQGSFSLRLLREIYEQYQVAASNNQALPILIAGNRDDNRLRFLTELANEDFLNDFYSPQARWWMGNEAGLLEEFCSQFTLAQYQELSIPQKRAHVAKWMLAKTMGSVKEFEYRRVELAVIRGEDVGSILDEQVAQSFIEEMCDPATLAYFFPEGSACVLPPAFQGVARWYIEHSTLYALSEAKDILYSHSAYQTGDCPFGNPVEQWVEDSNTARSSSIANIIMQVISGRLNAENDYGRQHPAIISSLPRSEKYPANRQSQNFFNVYGAPGQEVTLPVGIKLNVSGHQPVLQEMPMVLRDALGNLSIINADTVNPLPGGLHLPAYVQINSDASFVIKSADGLREINSSDSLIGQILNDGAGKTLHVTSLNTRTGQYHLSCYEKPEGTPFYAITSIVCMNKDAVKLLQPVKPKRSLSDTGLSSTNSHCLKFSRVRPAMPTVGTVKGVSDVAAARGIPNGSGRK